MRTGSGDERESALQSGWTVEAAPEHLEEDVQTLAVDAGQPPVGEAQDVESSQQMSNLTVVMLGLAGGIFMLYAWVWMSWAQYYSIVNAAVVEGSGSIGGFLQQIVYWIAPLAPVLWFVSALCMYRRHTRKLALALVIGLIVLLPLPMIFANGAAL